MSDRAIDPGEFRRALGAFVTGVTVVTTRAADGAAVGLTANSFNSVSLDPPMVLWSLALNSPNLAAFRQAGHWAVHVLSDEQQALSTRFATRGADKFSGVTVGEGPGGIPLLTDCAARFVCRSAFEYDGGDHAIFVGEVIAVEDRGARPLAFHGGGYGRVLANKRVERQSYIAAPGSFGQYFTGHFLAAAHRAAFADVQREFRRQGLRSSDYTALVALGIGDDVPIEVVTTRAREGGIDLPESSIARLVDQGYATAQGERLRLTGTGRKLLAEFAAVAEGTQLRVESRLSSEELTILHDLLARIVDTDKADEVRPIEPG